MVFSEVRQSNHNESDTPDVKPLQNGFTPIHLLSAGSSTSAAVASPGVGVASPGIAGTSAIPMSLIPVFQPNMFPQGIIGWPLTLTQQALFQANVAAAAKASGSGKETGLDKALQQSIALASGGKKDMKTSSKRKFSETTEETSLDQVPIPLNVLSPDDLANIQPRTNKGKHYSWMYGANPKRHRAKITEETKKEIIQFCKDHTLLKQGEIADIFGVDRTTVTKMLKKSQENADCDLTNIFHPTNMTRTSSIPQFELEDMLYRWINNTTKHNPNTAVWSCDLLLEQAEELQDLTEAGNNFVPTHEWLLDFVDRFKIRRVLTDYPTDSRKMKNKGSDRKVLPRPKPKEQLTEAEDLTNAQLSSRKIPKEKVAEYTIVETPLDIPMKIETAEEKKSLNVEELTTEEAHSRDMKQLDKFREQQKAIEEANKLKKDLLAKTLSERKQRAKKEAYKLEHIQKELTKLDHLLTADVNVVREKIEDASREFMEAQKRFQRAEKEYIESKIDLHSKSELKESLTEHLYTIIHQNEVRKAKKLADLMKELEMEGEDDDIQLPELPPLSSFQQTNIHVSPTTGQTILEYSKVKMPEKSQETANEKENESCDKNSNNIVILPSTPTEESAQTGNSETKSTENGNNELSSAENPSKSSEKVMPSFTIVEDGEPVSVVYDIEQDIANKENSKETTTGKESPKNSTDEKAPESEPEENTPKVKTKWDFDGAL